MPRKKHPVGIGMTACKSELGKFVRARRIKNGLTQMALAEKSRVEQNMLSALEIGNYQYPREEILRRLATALSCDFESLKKIAPVRQLAQPKTELGRLIYHRRKELGLSYAELAARMQTNPKHIRHMELTASPTVIYRTARKLAHALEIKVAELSQLIRSDYKPLDNKLGQLMRPRRKELGISSQELAEKLGVTSQMVNQIERGNCPLSESDELLAKIAAALQLKKSALMAVQPKRKLKKIVAKTPLGEILSNRKVELGLTLKEIGSLAGLAESTMSLIVRGEIQPHPKIIKKLSTALQCKIPPAFLRP